MADVIISYSRRNLEFVERLHSALEEEGFSTWIDWKDIPPTSDWEDEIYTGIEGADAFLFVISPDSVESPGCGKELYHAIETNKRLIPVVWRQVEPEDLHQKLAASNWIFFQEEDNFDSSFQSLAEAIRTDLEHTRTHTRLLQRASEWDTNNRDSGYLLRGSDLRAAKEWLLQTLATELEPQPTLLQENYITSGQKSRTRFQRIIASVVAIGLIIVTLATFALIQRQQAVVARNVAETRRQEAELAKAEEEKQRKFAEEQRQQAVTAKEEEEQQRRRAEEQANIALSRRLAEQAIQKLETDLELSILLALEAVKRANIEISSEGTIGIDEAKREAQHALHQATHARRIRRTINGHNASVNVVAYSPDGRRIVTASQDGTSKIWDVTSNEMLLLSGHTDSIIDADFSPDGVHIATASADGTAKIWDANSGQELQTINGHTQAVNCVAYSPDGKSLATAGDDKILINPGSTDSLIFVFEH